MSCFRPLTAGRRFGQLLPKETLSDETLLALVRAGCRSKPNVDGLTTEAIDALPSAAPQEVMRYLAALLRESLGSKEILSDDTLLALASAGYRHFMDVHAMQGKVADSLPAPAAEQVESFLRDLVRLKRRCLSIYSDYRSTAALSLVIVITCTRSSDITTLSGGEARAGCDGPGVADRGATDLGQGARGARHRDLPDRDAAHLREAKRWPEEELSL